MFSSLIAIVLLTSTAFAAPFESSELNERSSPVCTTYKSGYLAANVQGTQKSFTINSKNQVAYFGDGKNPLKVDFQKCSNDQDAGPGVAIDTIGQLYAPDYKKCIAITNQPAAVGPYWTILRPCEANGPGPEQKFDMRSDESNGVYWVGMTDEEGTTPQGGCGLLGYNTTSSNGAPWHTTDQWQQIRLTCATWPGHPFEIAKTAH